MKLFSKEIDKKLFSQYSKGSDLDNQVVVTKIFNPYGNGRWFLLNSDPQEPDYLWAIVQMGDVVEMGSVLRSELESVRVSPFRFPLERDLSFRMVNAGELFRGLQEGKFYKKGGWVDGYAKGGIVKKYAIVDENTDRIYIKDTNKEFIDLKYKELKEVYPNDKLSIIEFAHGGYMAKGGGIYTSDSLYYLQVIKDDKEVAREKFRAKSLKEAKEISEDEYESKYISKYGNPLNFIVSEAMEEGGKLIGNQKKLDVNKNGKLDSEDFKMLRGKKMAHGGEIDSEGKRLAENPNWTNEKLKVEYDSLKKDLQNFNNGLLKPSKVIGTGYKSSAIAKRLAKEWLEKNVAQYKKALEIRGVMAMGGKVKFADKVKEVKASLLKRKKVSPKVQKDYGKTYSPKEAEQSAKRIIGAQVKKYEVKKKFKKGGKTIAQTPAPLKDRVYGSSKNKVGSASSQKSAMSIKLNEDIVKTLTNKAKEYNENHSSKVSTSTLKAVMRRGMGAYSTSHRPTISGGAPNSRQAWGFARVNKFLLKKGGTKVKKAYVQDDDLLK